MVTHNKELLMAFVYFDQSHCGYLLERDLEEILYTLGLHLSRAQVTETPIYVRFCASIIGPILPRFPLIFPVVSVSNGSVFPSVVVLTFADQEAVEQTSDPRVLLLSKADRQREGRTGSVCE